MAFDDLTSFDGAWYFQIVTQGYTYAPDGGQHDIAFFPLYPATVGLLWRAGVPFFAASLFVSNAAFLAALVLAFLWVRRRCGSTAARWCVATLCCCPLSLFASAAYSESLYLLLSVAALLSADRMHFRTSAGLTVLASATRLIGIALLPAFLLTALLDRRRRGAWLPAVAAVAGIAGFALYCALRFGDPLAFVHAESAWRSGPHFDETAWQNLLGSGVASTPWVHAIALIAAAFLWLTRRRASFFAQLALWFAVLGAERWAWNGSEYVFLLTLVAGALAIVFRAGLGPAAVVYLLAGLALIAAAGAPISVDRYAYALFPSTVALALLWRRLPALGTAALAVMVVDLFEFSLRFAQHAFVA